MTPFILRILRLIGGLMIFATGIVLTLHAQIGYAPWDVFHVGLSTTFGITIGTASIYVSIGLVLIGLLLGEKPGLGTLLSMVLLGIFIDGVLGLDIIPVARTFPTGVFMMIAGLFVIAFAAFLYIGSGFGASPADTLMVALKRRTGWPIGLCRGGNEVIVALLGWRLGGMLGIGTLIGAFGIGVCIQWIFGALGFDPTRISHETLHESASRFRRAS